jgi:NADH-quinone oxidoreductase subunit J
VRAVALALLVAVVASPTLALAQGAPAPAPAAAPPADPAAAGTKVVGTTDLPPPTPTTVVKPSAAEPEKQDEPGEGSASATEAAPTRSAVPGKLRAIAFWLFALIVVGGSLATITRRNMVSAVMFLVATFMALGALYVLLFAHFIAVIQVLVYAGAIMVLFVFVVMILNKEEEEPWALRGLLGKTLAFFALAYLVVRLIDVFWGVNPSMADLARPRPEFGTTMSMGTLLFSDFLFPFEAVSIVLLTAVVGALVLAQPGVATNDPDHPPRTT